MTSKKCEGCGHLWPEKWVIEQTRPLEEVLKRPLRPEEQGKWARFPLCDNCYPRTRVLQDFPMPSCLCCPKGFLEIP